MNMRYLLAVLLAATVLLSGCGNSAPPPSAPTPTSAVLTATRVPPTANAADFPPTPVPAAPAANGLPAGWQEYASQEGAFKVWLPQLPHPAVTSSDTGFGKLDTHIFEVIMLDTGYTVAYTDLPAEVAQIEKDTLLNKIRDGQLSSIKATLREETPITLGGYPGREMIADAPGPRIVKSHSYLVNTRLYQVIVFTKSEKRLTNEGASFFDSFQIGEQAATTAQPPDADTWQRYAPADTGFAVLLPGTPQETSSAFDNSAGSLIMHQAAVIQPPRGYVVLYTDVNEGLSKEDPQQALDEARFGMADEAKGTIVSEQEITLQTYPGRDLYLRTAAGSTHIRMYKVEDRLYMLLAILPTADAAAADEVANTFFNSFSLLGR